MKKISVTIIFVILLATSVFADNGGIINTGGRSVPVSDETDRQTVESVESGYFSEITDFLQELFR